MSCELAVAASGDGPRPLIREAGDCLARNLADHVPPLLAKRVAETVPTRVSLRAGPGGRPELRLLGLPLCSSVEPHAEAEAWASRLSLDGADVIVVLGLALGHHVRAIRRRTAASIIVLEPSLEVMRVTLSNVLLDVDDLQILQSAIDLRDHLSSRLSPDQVMLHSAWPAYRRLFPEMNQAIRVSLEQAARLASVTAATLEKRAPLWTRNLIANLALCAGRVPSSGLDGWIAGRPAIIASAGPSLDKNLHQLARAQGRATIIAVNTSLRALERAGVRADLVVALEAVDVSSQLDGLEHNAGCVRVLDITAHPALFRGAAGAVVPFANQIPFFPSLTDRVGLGRGILIGGSVANAAFTLAHLMGASPIILVGQDLAYAGDRVYAAGTSFEDLRVQVNGGVAQLENLESKQRFAALAPEVDTTMPRREAERVPGWGGGEVWTNTEFSYFRCHFERYASLIPGVTLINATEGGSRIRGFQERRLAEVLDQLPTLPPPPLPASPTLQAPAIRGALTAELQAARQAGHLAGLAAAGRGAAAVQGMRDAMGRCCTLQSLAWPLVQQAQRGELELDAFCRGVASCAEELQQRLAGAVQQLS